MKKDRAKKRGMAMSEVEVEHSMADEKKCTCCC